MDGERIGTPMSAIVSSVEHALMHDKIESPRYAVVCFTQEWPAGLIAGHSGLRSVTSQTMDTVVLVSDKGTAAVYFGGAFAYDVVDIKHPHFQHWLSLQMMPDPVTGASLFSGSGETTEAEEPTL